MKLAAILILLGTALPAPALALELDVARLTEQEKVNFAAAAERDGLHCPKIVRAKKESESENGWLVRLTCASKDGASTWDIRLTGLPHWKPKFSSFSDPAPKNEEPNALGTFRRSKP